MDQNKNKQKKQTTLHKISEIKTGKMWAEICFAVQSMDRTNYVLCSLLWFIAKKCLNKPAVPGWDSVIFSKTKSHSIFWSNCLVTTNKQNKIKTFHFCCPLRGDCPGPPWAPIKSFRWIHDRNLSSFAFFKGQKSVRMTLMSIPIPVYLTVLVGTRDWEKNHLSLEERKSSRISHAEK